MFLCYNIITKLIQGVGFTHEGLILQMITIQHELYMFRVCLRLTHITNLSVKYRFNNSVVRFNLVADSCYHIVKRQQNAALVTMQLP